MGIFDPPVPVQPCTAGNCGNIGAGSAPTTVAIPITTPSSDQSSSSSAVPSPPLPSSGPSSTQAATTVGPTSTPAIVDQPSPLRSELIQLPSSQSISTSSNSNQAYPTQSNPDQSTSTTQTPFIGATTPIAVATLSDSVVISAIAGGSSAIIGSQTVFVGGPPVTISDGGVISLAPSSAGIVLSNSGSISTIYIPSPTTPVLSPTGQTLGVIAGQTISGNFLSSSQLLIGSQTLSIGGAVKTLPGNQIASLGSSGLVIQAPSGALTTYALPTSTPALIGIIAGHTVTGVALGTSAAVVGGQTLSVGGAVVTLAGNQVASLGVSALLVQVPGGGVTTIAVQAVTSGLQSSSGNMMAPYTVAVGPGTTYTGVAPTSASQSHITTSGRNADSSTSSSISTSTGIGGIILKTFEGSGGVHAMHLGWLAYLTVGIIFVLQ